MRIYVDNNATTRIHPDAVEAMAAAFRAGPANPSSVHREGQAARRLLEEARESVAELIGAPAREIVFTSGGTESNNAAIFGFAGTESRSHIVTSSIEHPSVEEAVARLEARGWAADRVAPDPDGRVPAERMIAALRPETSLVILMLANNETGVLQPVAEVAEECRKRGIPLHCDAVQAVGKVPVEVSSLGAGTVALAAHKMHGPVGIGALRVRSGLILEPFLSGGSQERRRRAGTESIALAAGFGVAARAAKTVEREPARELRDEFERRVLASLPGARIHGAGAARIPNTSSVLFAGCDAESIVMALDLRGIAASAGSACSSGRLEPSRVLIAMGVSDEDARSSVRFSFSRMNHAAEIEPLIGALREVVPAARRSGRQRAAEGAEAHEA